MRGGLSQLPLATHKRRPSAWATQPRSSILLEGVGIQIHFKPDRPWKNEGEKRAPKYRSPLGDYDAMLPIHPDDKAYWDDLEALKPSVTSRGASLPGHH
jgi:putative DNA primase/helicase